MYGSKTWEGEMEYMGARHVRERWSIWEIDGEGEMECMGARQGGRHGDGTGKRKR